MALAALAKSPYWLVGQLDCRLRLLAVLVHSRRPEVVAVVVELVHGALVTNVGVERPSVARIAPAVVVRSTGFVVRTL